jgi:hypothetical protein
MFWLGTILGYVLALITLFIVMKVMIYKNKKKLVNLTKDLSKKA